MKVKDTTDDAVAEAIHGAHKFLANVIDVDGIFKSSQSD